MEQNGIIHIRYLTVLIGESNPSSTIATNA